MATSTQVTGEQPACARSATRTSSSLARRTCGTCSRSIQLPGCAWRPSRSRGWRSTRGLRWRKVSQAAVIFSCLRSSRFSVASVELGRMYFVRGLLLMEARRTTQERGHNLRKPRLSRISKFQEEVNAREGDLLLNYYKLAINFKLLICILVTLFLPLNDCASESESARRFTPRYRYPKGALRRSRVGNIPASFVLNHNRPGRGSNSAVNASCGIGRLRRNAVDAWNFPRYHR